MTGDHNQPPSHGSAGRLRSQAGIAAGCWRLSLATTTSCIGCYDRVDRRFGRQSGRLVRGAATTGRRTCGGNLCPARPLRRSLGSRLGSLGGYGGSGGGSGNRFVRRIRSRQCDDNGRPRRGFADQLLVPELRGSKSRAVGHRIDPAGNERDRPWCSSASFLRATRRYVC